jgi:hypothetical protein
MEIGSNSTEKDVIMALMINGLAKMSRKHTEVEDDPDDAYIQGYENGWQEAFTAAEMQWKEDALKYRDLSK